VDLADVIQQCRERLPDGGNRVVVDSIPSVMVRGDDQLDTVVAELVTTALDRTDDEVALDVTPGEETIELTVTAAGDWLTDVEQTVLLEGPPEYDRPDFGYGISIVRLLVDRYGGSLAVSAPTERTAVTVELLRTMEDPPPGESSGVAPADLRDAAVAGLGAGLAMGALLQVFTGQVAVIGSLYGLRSLPVGWVVHLFHSVLFSTVAVVTIRRTRLARVVPKPRKLVAVGVSYGLVLWLVGAGFLMPAWLLAVGGTSPIPNLQPGSLMAHLGWGVWLGASLALLLPNSPLGRVSPSS
jgi:two-component system OmpR family sensor kinase